MARSGLVLGILLALSGLIWMLQGMNSRFAPRSFMTDSKEWILFGAIAVVAGLWLATRSRRRM
jgi:hypothetical protein